MKGQIGLFDPYGVWMISHSHDPPEIPSLSSLFHFAPLTHLSRKNSGLWNPRPTLPSVTTLFPFLGHLEWYRGMQWLFQDLQLVYSMLWQISAFRSITDSSLMKKSVSIHLFLLCSSFCLESSNTLGWIVLGTLKKFCFC